MALTPAQLAFCTRYLGHGRAGRLAGTYELLEDIAALGVPDEANAEERAAVAGLAKNVRALLDDNASDKELTAAKGFIEQAEIKIREIGDRLDKARAAAATLHARYVELPKKLPEATPAETRKAFTDDVDAQLEALMGAPATATLRAAGDALPGFAQRIQDIKDTLAHEQEERNTKAAGLALDARTTGATLDKDALPAMSEARDTLLDKIAAAETTPVSPEALTALADAKSALEKAVAEAGARMEVLRDILDTAAPLLARLVPEVDKLRAHARAPQADAEEIRKDAASLLTASDDFTDLAKIDTAGLTVEAARGLEAKIFAIEERMAQLNSETEAAIAKVEAAEKLATAAVSSPKGRRFSKAQRDAFADQIDAQLKRFAGDLTLADDVAGELGKLAAGFATLSRALQSYEKRIAGVTRPARDTLSTKETATLDAAEKAARDALDAVLTL